MSASTGCAARRPGVVSAPVLLCLCGLPHTVLAERPRLAFEAGVVVDVFSESYGAGDLFFDRSDLPAQTDEPDEALRIRNDETLVGGRLGLSWSPGDGYDRRIEVDYEQNEASATGDVDARWRFEGAGAWRLDVDETLRLQVGLTGAGDSRDVFQSLDLDLSRELSASSRLTVSGEQTFSRVSGDSLSRLFDYTSHELGLTLDRRFGELDARWTIDAAYRNASSEVSSNHLRVNAGAEIHRYAFNGTSVDASLLASRRSYDASGLVSPSNVELLLDARASHPIGSGFDIACEGEGLGVRFDDPEATYFDYDTASGEAGVIWRSTGGLAVDLMAGGEWLRPRSGESGAYDQSRVRTGVSFLGPGSLWIDVEESFGRRNYLGGSTTGGLLNDQGSLGFSLTDFFYNEVSLLLGWSFGQLGVDAYAQYTVEAHDESGDDLSFVIGNLRVVARY